MPRTFSVEAAKSGRSKCKCCNEKIAKNEIRMATIQEAGDDSPAFTKWFHLKCFKKKIRKGPATKSDIANFKSLNGSAQKKVMKYVFGEGDESSSSESDDEPQTTKKTKKRKLESDGSENDEPPKKKMKLSIPEIESLTVKELKDKCKAFDIKSSGTKKHIQERLKEYIEQNKNAKKKKKKASTKQDKKTEKRYNEIVDDLKCKTVKELKQMLAQNGVKRTGNKSEVIHRIADCMLYGTYPRCPECHGGTLQVEYDSKFGHNGQGRWSCKGFMDDDHFRHCHFKSDEVFERPQWEN